MKNSCRRIGCCYYLLCENGEAKELFLIGDSESMEISNRIVSDTVIHDNYRKPVSGMLDCAIKCRNRFALRRFAVLEQANKNYTTCFN